MEKRKYKANPESWGAIRKLASGRCQASYVGPDSERYNAPHTFDTLGDARAWLAGIRTDIQRGKWRSPHTVAAERFGKYATAWVQQRVSSKGEPLRPKTRAEYERQLAKGLAHFADSKLTDITPARVRTWHADRLTAGPTQAGAEARLLRAILNTAVLDGIIERNPVDTRFTKSTTGKEHRPPTLNELSVVLEEIDPFYRLAVELAAYGGLRLGEWRALRRKDIALDGARVKVTIERAVQRISGQGWHVGPPKSAEGKRTVVLPAALTADVQRHLDGYVGAFPESLVFPSGGASDFIDDKKFNRAWDKARKVAGVLGIVREHDLRAFAGTMHALGGATLRETMVFLGHSTTTAAMAYQATTGRDAELADRMPLPIANPIRIQHLKEQAGSNR